MAKKAKLTRTQTNLSALKLEDFEKLILWRRRKQWNQQEAANYFNISVFNYKLVEYGAKEKLKIPKINLGKILDYEKCFILRRRRGLTQNAIANKIGCSAYWLRRQELGEVSAAKLVEFWTQK